MTGLPTSRRVLVVPAAGRGSRLGSALPKALVPVGGRPMLQWLLDLYEPWVCAIVVVSHPSAQQAMRETLVAGSRPVAVVTQDEPTGMLDAVGIGCDVGSSRVDLQACKLEYSIVSPK